MKNYYFLLLTLLMTSCNTAKKDIDVSLLNGYWEISEVSFPSGQKKPYKVNTSVDYISLENNEGYLKKMNPGLNGRYTTTNSTLYFTLVEKEGNWHINFKDQSQQNSRLVHIDSNHYSIINERNIQYFYTRYFPIDISHE